MGSALDHASPVHDQDLIGCQNRAEAVGDHDTGPPGHHPFERLLDERLRLAVQAAGCLIKHQDARILQNDPRQRDALFFSPAQAITSLPDNCLVPVGQVHDEIVDVGSFRSFFDFRLAGIQLGIEQVRPDGIVEQVGFLGHHADLRGERGQADIP